jgi:hypothetical protein
MNTKSACHRALQTTEVLENILVHLPIRELFLYQNVCEKFRATIAGSPAIRRQMFLALPDTPRESWVLVQGANPARKDKTKWSFECADAYNDSDGWHEATPVTLNPLLKVFWTTRHALLHTPARKRMNTSGNEHVRVEGLAKDVSSTSSLLATYISDPPCQHAVVSTEFIIKGVPATMTPGLQPQSMKSAMVKVQSETGLKLGDLWDAALDALGQYRWKDEYGIIRAKQVVSLRAPLRWWKNPNFILSLPWSFELVDVVVPTAEEWADVRKRNAVRKCDA